MKPNRRDALKLATAAAVIGPTVASGVAAASYHVTSYTDVGDGIRVDGVQLVSCSRDDIEITFPSKDGPVFLVNHANPRLNGIWVWSEADNSYRRP